MKEIKEQIMLQIKLIWNDYQKLIILIMMAFKLKVGELKKNGKDRVRIKD